MSKSVAIETRSGRRRWIPRRWKLWAALVLLATALAAVIGAVLLYSTPDWYHPLSPTDAGIDELQGRAQVHVAELGNRFENAAFAEYVWTITQDEINAELAAPNVRWAGVVSPMVIFSPGHVTVCARVPAAPGGAAGGVLTVVLKVQTVVTPDGHDLLVAPESVYLGRLRLPLFLVRRAIEPQLAGLSAKIHQALLMNSGAAAARDDTALATEWIEHGLQGEAYRPRFVRHGRSIAVKELLVEDGRLTIVVGPGT